MSKEPRARKAAVKKPDAKPAAARNSKSAKPRPAATEGAEPAAEPGDEAAAEPIEPEVIPLEADAVDGEDGALDKTPLAALVATDDDEPAEGDDEAEEEAGDAADSPDSVLELGRPTARLPGTDLSRADALARYLSEISRHPLLSREDEHTLAARFKETQDPAIAYRLVTANLRLVVKIAMEFRRAAFNVLDLIQEGNVGLMQAVQKYDPHRGVKLSSYAAWWIRAYILRYLMDNWRMVKLGTTQAQRKLFFNLRKEQEKLLSQGFEAAPKLLAEKLDVSEQDIREMDQRLGNDELSIDAPVSSSDDSRQTYGDRLSETARGAEEQLGDEELRRVFRDNLAKFGETLTTDKDRFLFENRIAVPDGKEPLTLQQIGEKYGFTRERARQIEARLTDRLREFLRERMPDFAQLSFNEPEVENDQ